MKIIGYLELGTTHTLQSKFTDEVSATVDTAWASIIASGSFVNTSGLTIYVRGAMFYQDARVSDDGVVQLANVDGITPTGANTYGSLAPLSGAVSSHIINLDTDAYRTAAGTAYNDTINITSEPVSPQYTLTLTWPVGRDVVEVYGSAISFTGQNTTGGDVTLNAKVTVDGVLEPAITPVVVLAGRAWILQIVNVSPTVFRDGAVVEVKLWVDSGSVTVRGQGVATLPVVMSYADGDLQLQGAVVSPVILTDIGDAGSVEIGYSLVDPETGFEGVTEYYSSGVEITEILKSGLKYSALTGYHETRFEANGSGSATMQLLSVYHKRYARTWTYR